MSRPGVESQATRRSSNIHGMYTSHKGTATVGRVCTSRKALPVNVFDFHDEKIELLACKSDEARISGGHIRGSDTYGPGNLGPKEEGPAERQTSRRTCCRIMDTFLA
jgi:hypothetical protein